MNVSPLVGSLTVSLSYNWEPEALHPSEGAPNIAIHLKKCMTTSSYDEKP